MSEPQRPLNTVHAFCSLFLPGLGQLCQERYAAAIGFFLMFLLTGAMPIAIVFELMASQYPKHAFGGLLAHFLMFDVLCVFVLSVMFCAGLDAAAWQRGNRTRFKKPLIILSIGYPLFLPLILSPTIQPSREENRRVVCMNNMRQIVFALHAYCDNRGRFPPAHTVDETGKPLHSWRVLILPYLEQQTLYEKIRLNEPWDSEHNRQFHSQVPRIFQCPTGNWQLPMSGGCHYSIIYGAAAAFSETEPKKYNEGKDHDGTILFVERKIPVNWMDPTSEISFATACEGINVNAMGIGSFHYDGDTRGANVGFGDGRIQFLLNNTDGKTLRTMLTLNGEMPAAR
jgi:hypothetical protein